MYANRTRVSHLEIVAKSTINVGERQPSMWMRRNKKLLMQHAFGWWLAFCVQRTRCYACLKCAYSNKPEKQHLTKKSHTRPDAGPLGHPEVSQVGVRSLIHKLLRKYFRFNVYKTLESRNCKWGHVERTKLSEKSKRKEKRKAAGRETPSEAGKRHLAIKVVRQQHWNQFCEEKVDQSQLQLSPKEAFIEVSSKFNNRKEIMM